MFAFSPFEVYRCCQHNVSHGWPYYAEELWLATADHGLCASLYSASEVSAEVGTGSILCEFPNTKPIIPFSERINFTVSTERAANFPLYLRCAALVSGAEVAINGKPSRSTTPLNYIVYAPHWKNVRPDSARFAHETDLSIGPRTTMRFLSTAGRSFFSENWRKVADLRATRIGRI
jgi:DUF1680 family protein